MLGLAYPKSMMPHPLKNDICDEMSYCSIAL
jgi:hypothetical protein